MGANVLHLSLRYSFASFENIMDSGAWLYCGDEDPSPFPGSNHIFDVLPTVMARVLKTVVCCGDQSPLGGLHNE